MDPHLEDFFVVQIPVWKILDFISRKTGQGDLKDLLGLLMSRSVPQLDWHRLIRSGLKVPLHLNLGIPEIEIPEHPVEENPEVLLAAVFLGLAEIPVILSGELEIALEAGLIDEHAMSNLRNIIRATS